MIEFVGLPGTGKTTLSKQLALETGLTLCRQATMKKGRLVAIIHFSIFHPITMLCILRCILRKQHTPFWFKVRLFKGVLPAYRKKLMRIPFILDEGLLQRFLATTPPDAFEAHLGFVNHIPNLHKHVFVLCCVSESIRQARLSERTSVPREKLMSESNRWEWEADVIKNNQTLERFLVNNTRCLIIDTGDPDKAFKSLLKGLKSFGVIC